MIRKQISAILICLLLATFTAPFVPAQNDKKLIIVKSQVAKYNTNKKKGVNVKMRDGRKLKGYISRMGADDFDVTDSKNGQVSTLVYADVSSVKRINAPSISKTTLVAIVGSIGVVLLVVVVVGAYCGSGRCKDY